MPRTRASFPIAALLLLVACSDDPMEPRRSGGDATYDPADSIEYSMAPGATQLSLGGEHGCALDATGHAHCWGDNAFRQLGRTTGGTCGEFFRPCATRGGPVRDDHVFTRIAAGEKHTCAIDTAGHVWCWGDDQFGQLGDGTETFTPSTRPGRAATGSRVFVDIAAGLEHTCALTEDGVAFCWGRNLSGQLGNGSIGQSATPQRVALQRFSAIAAGGWSTCGIDARPAHAGRVLCWGLGTSGQLGQGQFADSNVPVPVTGSDDFVAVDVGTLHACGLRDGDAWCWGRNFNGQLGNNSNTDSSVPVKMIWSGGVTDELTHIAAGGAHSCALGGRGLAWCWGRVDHGQIGNRDTVTAAPIAYEVPGADYYVDIDAGAETTCARRSGNISCWGLNRYGTAGRPLTYDTCFGQPCASISVRARMSPEFAW